jgi:hypothetical protein
MPFKYSNLNLRMIAIFQIFLFFKRIKNKNHFAGVMKITPLFLLFSHEEFFFIEIEISNKPKSIKLYINVKNDHIV